METPAGSDGEPALALETLVTMDHDLEPYVLRWGSPDSLDGALDFYVMVVMKRQDGVMLATPRMGFPFEALEAANGGADGVLGASSEIQVPLVVLDGGVVQPTGIEGHVTLVDCKVEILESMRHMLPFENPNYGFDADSPFALPDATSVLAKAWDWISSAGSGEALAFYSAEEVAIPKANGPLDSQGTTPQATPKRRRAPAAKAALTPQGTGTLPGEPPKAKKATTASLAAAMEGILQTLPGLTSQIQSLAAGQRELENRLVSGTMAAAPAFQQPLSRAVQGKASGLSGLGLLVPPPPKTAEAHNHGLLRSPLLHQPSALLELEEGKPTSSALQQGDPLAHAVLAQSQALTSLVNQIAQGQSDPLMDLGASSSTGTRGSAGRAKLMAELALQKGTFFASVMHSMQRRMNPTLPVSDNFAGLLEKGVCGTKYLERFGGYGRHRDLGTIQYQVMQLMDFLQADNIPAARDSCALLAVALEQAVMDGGRFELASVLTLQDDLPASIFLNRNVGAFSRSRSFAPLAEQRWVTVALAYLKELDTIQAKRTELEGKPKPNTPPPGSPAPKAKPNAKRKGRGRGQNQTTTNQEDFEEA